MLKSHNILLTEHLTTPIYNKKGHILILEAQVCAKNIFLTLAIGSECDIFRLHVCIISQATMPCNLLFIHHLLRL